MRKFQYALAKGQNFEADIEDCYTALNRKYFKTFVKYNDIDNIIKDKRSVKSLAMISARSISYFMIQHSNEVFNARADLIRFFSNNRFLHDFSNLTDNKLLVTTQSLMFKRIKVMKVFYVSKSIFESNFTPHTPYNLKWRVLKRKFNLHGIDYKKFIDNRIFDEKKPETFQIRFFTNTSIDLNQCIFEEGNNLTAKQRSSLRRIIFHFHGGGYIAMSSTSHQGYLRKFVRSSECCVFSVDYPLAPVSKYKATIDIVFKSYLFLLVI